MTRGPIGDTKTIEIRKKFNKEPHKVLGLAPVTSGYEKWTKDVVIGTYHGTKKSPELYGNVDGKQTEEKVARLSGVRSNSHRSEENRSTLRETEL